ncbi:Sec-independent protein translocase TatC [Staphylococcus aureus subsp. aureus 112808A]|nr:Sec-independent protein translocase TatC [Staphylococcus aureus subsp. aureus 112808A]
MPNVNNQRMSSIKYALKPMTGEMFKVNDNFNAN